MHAPNTVISIQHICPSCKIPSFPCFEGIPKTLTYTYECGHCNAHNIVDEILDLTATNFNSYNYAATEEDRLTFPLLNGLVANDNSEEPSIYLESISTSKDLRIGDHNVALSDSKRTDLILTGKNGSGKSTLLNNIKEYLSILDNITLNYKDRLTPDIYPDVFQEIISTLEHSFYPSHKHSEIKIHFESIAVLIEQNSIFSYFDAKRLMRSSVISNIGKPEASLVNIDNDAASQFLQYLVNRKSQQSMAFTDGDLKEAEEIKQWFIGLEDFFSKIFGGSMKLKFNREKFTFTLVDDHNNTVNLTGLSDGYSAVLQIVSDIIIRMEANKFGDFNQFGIVLIDEIETHLHVSLQKQVFPLLKSFFPSVQFIITTHSPFVLSSVEEAVIYDMEHKTTITTDQRLWQYSYEALIDGYFEVDKFSDVLKEKIARFKTLSTSDDLGRPDKKELRQLKKELENVPTFKNATIETELKQLGLK